MFKDGLTEEIKKAPFAAANTILLMIAIVLGFTYFFINRGDGLNNDLRRVQDALGQAIQTSKTDIDNRLTDLSSVVEQIRNDVAKLPDRADLQRTGHQIELLKVEFTNAEFVETGRDRAGRIISRRRSAPSPQ